MSDPTHASFRSVLSTQSSALPTIRHLEEFTTTAWPATGEVILDGWLVRFAGGYTRRSNSVHPFYPGSLDVAAKVAACEAMYRDAGLPTRFKLTPASEPAGLEAVLAERAYRYEGGASVQVLDASTADVAPFANVREWESPSAEWLDAYATFNDVPDRHRETLRSIVAAIVPRRRFVALVEDGQPVACGLGVAQPPYLGLFDIVVRPDRRRRGLGRRLIAHLLHWGKTCGATTACLQVAHENAPALALYAGMGFREAYAYRYLVKD